MGYYLVHSIPKFVFNFFVDVNLFITCNFIKVSSFGHFFPAAWAKEYPLGLDNGY